MRRIITIILSSALAASVLSIPASAGKGNGVGVGHCPPGLAKKNPPCIPPGLAKKGDWIGEFPYIFLDRDRYGLDRRYGWYQLGDNIYVRTDKETGEILELFSAIAAVLD